MSRQAAWPPPIYVHKPSGKERVRLRSGGIVRDVTLGPVGSEEARKKYLEIISAGEGRQPAPTGGESRRVTVSRAIALWWAYADRAYAGRTEHKAFVYPLRALGHLHGELQLASVSRRHLKQILGLFASGYSHPSYGQQRPQSRKVANRNLTRLKTFLRWCAEEGMISATQLAELCLVRGLAHGEATDKPVVVPVHDRDVEAVMPFLKPVVRGLVQCQLYTGARPSELLGLRIHQIDNGRATLIKHKTSHTGAERVILFGPKAMEIIAKLCQGRPASEYVFSPRENLRLWRESQRATRKTRVQPSQLDRSRKNARQPGACYTGFSYRQAIVRACIRAKVKPFSPYQLRHAFATRCVEEFGEEGWEIARVALGHKTVSTTRLYVAESFARAEEALRKIG